MLSCAYSCALFKPSRGQRCSDHTHTAARDRDPRAESSRTEPSGPVRTKRHSLSKPKRTDPGEEERVRRVMTLPTVRQLFIVCLFWFLGCCSSTDASPYDQWEDDIEFRKVRGIQGGDLNDVLWRDQDEEQVQNVFKRFLFHYSKALDSVGAVQHESHSVHPLMRLSPKLSQRRKVLLLKI
ncbi:uncharacterized protein nms isoform X2 [Pleuronectes platessa]|uniref:uncharacterized protein nms isoform X2 n=1 Tax=Pleuronectes platessa TaxID=8262 RepID=UPI00232A6495|nr:uncharacterized protein nms isoform X2 [Pleuronectes platessa]